ncbi:hypothetical protein L2E82_17972 [Cichorium intybus]|uniref:Uncharacterized protein n=1 Tax=Cichorium intybus TaxID=13427 RepID=A0ACB9F935_CICIN|nr:hypothetical protein L2E82_17972 [Cichorium intybus]
MSPAHISLRSNFKPYVAWIGSREQEIVEDWELPIKLGGSGFPSIEAYVTWNELTPPFLVIYFIHTTTRVKGNRECFRREGVRARRVRSREPRKKRGCAGKENHSSGNEVGTARKIVYVQNLEILGL